MNASAVSFDHFQALLGANNDAFATPPLERPDGPAPDYNSPRAIAADPLRSLADRFKAASREHLVLVTLQTQAAIERTKIRVRKLLAEGDVRGARLLAAEVDEPWARLLDTPRTRAAPAPSGSREAFTANASWLRRHQDDDKYRGQWVALSAGAFVDCDPSLAALRVRLRERGNTGVFLVRL